VRLALAALALLLAACGSIPPPPLSFEPGEDADPKIHQACSTTNQTCARCHDVGKIVMTHFDNSLAWRQLVLRMRRLPSSGITDAEVHAAETCLVYHDLGRRGLDELAALDARRAP
jgi:hypothetical protein